MGMKVICTNSSNGTFTKGKVYNCKRFDSNGIYDIIHNYGWEYDYLIWQGELWKFEVIEEESKRDERIDMANLDVVCIESKNNKFKVDKTYKYNRFEDGRLHVLVGENDKVYTSVKLQGNLWKFEIK